jgi:hypothetical protein
MAKFRYMLIASLLFLAGPSPSTAQDNSGLWGSDKPSAQVFPLKQSNGSHDVNRSEWETRRRFGARV